MKSARFRRQLYETVTAVMKPLRGALRQPLETIHNAADDQRRETATGLLIDLFSDDSTSLTDIFTTGTVEQVSQLLESIGDSAFDIDRLTTLAKEVDGGQSVEERIASARRRSMAGALLLRLRREDGWLLFGAGTSPDCQNHLIHRLRLLGVDPRLVAGRLARETDPASQRALLQALGEYTPAELGSSRDRVIETAVWCLRHREGPFRASTY